MKRTLCALILCLAPAAVAQTAPPSPGGPHAGHGAAAPKQEKSTPAAEQYFTDLELLDQDGKKVRLYTDLLKGKTVVVNTFFATCPTVCPPLTANLKKVQDHFGDRVGKDLFFVSITVDPETDTPEKLRAFAQKFQTKSGWSFVTGKKENVDRALYKFGQYVKEKNDHGTVLLIGNVPTELWKKAYGLAPRTDLIKIITEVLDDRSVTK